MMLAAFELFFFETFFLSDYASPHVLYLTSPFFVSSLLMSTVSFTMP